MDLHIHIPAGGIPKDGPSAGVTMLTAITSLLTNRKIKKDLAMTGEITLRGAVLPVGGIKEKILAAYRAGIKTIIMPTWNRKDLEDIPAHVQKSIKFYFVNDMMEVLKLALENGSWKKQAAPLTKKDKVVVPMKKQKSINIRKAAKRPRQA
jgi:ATP-dependent Lon protease